MALIKLTTINYNEKEGTYTEKDSFLINSDFIIKVETQKNYFNKDTQLVPLLKTFSDILYSVGSTNSRVYVAESLDVIEGLIKNALK